MDLLDDQRESTHGHINPPEDFRQLSIFPQVSDLCERKDVFLRKNLQERAYDSTDHYLDVQFRLLREDFIRPLREGIDAIISKGNNIQLALRSDKGSNLKIYTNVTILYPKATVQGVIHKIQFNGDRLKRIKWEHSKRLMFGNMVCLSADSFKTNFLFAVIADRNIDDLKSGFICIKFGNVDSQAIQNIDMKSQYAMVETNAFFEAYRHVLAGLKDLSDADLPLKRYIVHSSKDMQPPAYLRKEDGGRDKFYDLNCLSLKCGKVLMSGEGDWPSHEDLQLNSYQAEALKLALTNELALIHGPPGTGKTHVGLAVMKVLLRNKSVWKKKTGPIIVICYTNHALDQFLEGIVKFHRFDSIVRVGSRCKNEKLKRFTLTEKRKTVNRTTQRMDYRIKGELKAKSREMTSSGVLFDVSSSCIPRWDTLQQYMLRCHKDQFVPHLKSVSSPDVLLLRWLGVSCNDNSIKGQIMQRGMPKLEIEMLNLAGFRDKQLLNALLSGMRTLKDLYQWANEKKINVIDVLPAFDFGYNYDMVVKSLKEIKKHGWGFANKRNSLVEWLNEHHELVTEQREENNEEDVIQHHRTLDIDFSDISWNSNKNNKKIDHEISNVVYTRRHVTDMINEQFQNCKTVVDKQLKDHLRNLLIRTTESFLPEQERSIHNIWRMSLKDRWKLLRSWIGRWKNTLVSTKVDDDYENLCTRLEEANDRFDEAIMKNADLVALTTTGAAKKRKILNNLNCQIVIVEEAAECLEAHIVAAMPRSTEHLILIGDHQQLKPAINVYDLAKKYNLDLSMFERMIKNGIPCQSLVIQHRMKPAIADLIRPEIYSKLHDSASVHEYEDVKGMKHSLFFVSHNEPETAECDGKSKSNRHEAEFVVALSDYLVLQGYKSQQITILVAYTGQLFEVKKFLQNSRLKNNRVRVAAVDNFQGEENDIIILSVVRSNIEGNIGFLKLENRICVALSRAKLGLYCIGNFEMLKDKSQIWSAIVKKLQDKNAIGEYLPLQCPNHCDKITQIRTAHDFKLVPEGGCKELCTSRMECGHSCPRVCHADDQDHKIYPCRRPCPRMCPANQHSCKNMCYEKCTLPKCGHECRIPCSRDIKTYECKEERTDTLNCGHEIKRRCGQPVITDVDSCLEKCDKILSCGHKCPGTCKDCMQGALHVPCVEKCSRVLVCGHICKSSCSQPCPPCTEKCSVRCKHSYCDKQCGQPCVPCKEKCERSTKCRHSTCTKYCGDVCDVKPCNKPCYRILRCFHKCIGLCGEDCPSLCRRCNKKEVTEIFFGDEDEEDARFIQLENCGHIFTYKSLDQYMTMLTSDAEYVGFKKCPRCSVEITSSRRRRRYRGILNQHIRNVNEVKERILGTFSQRRNAIRQLHISFSQLQSSEGLLYRSFSGQIEKFYETFKKSEKLLSTTQLAGIENKLNKINVMIEMSLIPGHSPRRCFTNTLEKMLKWTLIPRENFGDSEETEFKILVDLLNQYLQLMDIFNQTRNSENIKEIDPLIRKCLDIIFRDNKTTTEQKVKLLKEHKEKIKELAGYIPSMGITVQEKASILKAFSFNKGHWYKCPNGHVYCITECGGATQTAHCPECNEEIGGRSHRLLPTNSIATEMDGAVQPAYDPDNNYIPPEAFD